MSCPAVFLNNETGNVLKLMPIGNTTGGLSIDPLPPNPGPGGPYLPNQPFDFIVVGNGATVTYATSATGFVTTTVFDLVNAWNADPVLSTLAVASPVGTESIPDFPQGAGWACAGGATNVTLGLKGMKVYSGKQRIEANV